MSEISESEFTPTSQEDDIIMPTFEEYFKRLEEKNYNIATALQNLCPKARWIVHNNTYESIEWIPENEDPLPSREVVEAEVDRLRKEWFATEYQRLRVEEYPSAGELADAVYWQAMGDSSKMEAYIAACEAVKKKYPKP
jgi:hypothetical protein